MYNPFKRKNIAILGGTGSIGQELIKHLLEYNPGKIVVFSRRDHDQKLTSRRFNDSRLRFIIGDVRDRDSLDMALNGIDLCINTVALKHIEIAETNPIEYKKTIVDGGINVIESCVKNNVERLIVLSTDKSSSPVGVYGACKLLSDRIHLASNKLYNPKTKISIIRYGNVISSNGSILDIMGTKAENINITNIDMTRFFITKSYAADLIIHLAKYMNGGEILIPKIPSAKVIDMLKYNAQKDANINVIGMRCHEKIHESMFNVEDCTTILEFKNYYLQFLNIPSRDQLCFAGEEGKSVKSFEYNSSNSLTDNIETLYTYHKEL